MTAFRISGRWGVSPPSGQRRSASRRGRAYRRALGSFLSAALLAGLVVVPAHAQAPNGCYPGEAPEESGPTDISAVTGNQTLTAAFNPKGTMTVLKWPSPSFYDQLDYRTTDRSEPRMGAEPNDGAFLGLAWRRKAPKSKWHFSWLRDWRTSQRYVSADADEIVTTHRNRSAGLRVRVRDVVSATNDALVRNVRVSRSADSPARLVRLFTFANFNPVYSKTARAPEGDWCMDDATDEGAVYIKDADAVVHASQGTDQSTGRPSSVALAMAFDGPSDGHSIGVDPGSSAYDDATDASLANNGSTNSNGDTAIFDRMRLVRKRATTTSAIITAARSQKAALDALAATRSRGANDVRKTKAQWWRKWLKVSPLPKGAPKAVVRVAKRSLITLRQAIDRKGMIVTSVATQSPLALDWVRNGAYMNAALHEARHPREVRRHNAAYVDHQAKLEASTTPRGNWPTSMYADGVPGSATAYEIDSTGFGIWTLWDTYTRTKDVNYLAGVYEPIRRAADHLTDTCVDATTGLHCFANEEGGTTLTRTLVGAQAALMGLRAAVAAGANAMKAFDHSSEKRDDWRARRNQLQAAIVEELYDAACKCYTRDIKVGGTMLWPAKLFPRRTKPSNRQADLNWRGLRKRISGEVKRGGMEARAILGNAHAWAGLAAKKPKLKRALTWLAEDRVTRGTGLLGGAWRLEKGRVQILRSQPHAWHHAMFYLAALKTYGKHAYSF